MLLAGLAWFGADWEGAEDAPALLRSLGALVAPFSLVLVLHLALALPGGRIRSPAARTAVAAAYAITAAVSIGRALLRDPLLDLYCWRNCGDNTFLVHADPGIASALGDIWLWSALAIAVGVIAVAAHRLLTATRPARRVAAPAARPRRARGRRRGGLRARVAAHAAGGPERTGFAAIFLARVARVHRARAGPGVERPVRVPRTRARVARLAGELGERRHPASCAKRSRPRSAIPDIDVLYPRAGLGQLIDADGQARRARGAGRAVDRDHPPRPTARSRACTTPRSWTSASSSARSDPPPGSRSRTRRCAPRRSPSSRELRASRARIVEAGDAERRRLERNLHDGAQQRLLALSYDLRLARAGAAATVTRSWSALLDAAGARDRHARWTSCASSPMASTRRS